jgi:hypothetical protein
VASDWFEVARRLTIFGDSKEYESFSIQPGDIFVKAAPPAPG